MRKVIALVIFAFVVGGIGWGFSALQQHEEILGATVEHEEALRIEQGKQYVLIAEKAIERYRQMQESYKSHGRIGERAAVLEYRLQQARGPWYRESDAGPLEPLAARRVIHDAFEHVEMLVQFHTEQERHVTGPWGEDPQAQTELRERIYDLEEKLDKADALIDRFRR